MDIHQIGVPAIVQTTVGSGAGGNVNVPLTPPTGQIYILKGAEVINADVAARAGYFYLTDDISAYTMTLQYDAAIGAGASNWLNMSRFAAPFVLSPGRLRFHTTIAAVGAAVNITMNCHVHVLFGVWPLL